MMLEDATSGSLSSVDFGRTAEAIPKARGLALPPPTEFIQAPVDVLDTEAALLEAEQEKQSTAWRAQVASRKVWAETRRKIDQGIEGTTRVWSSIAGLLATAWATVRPRIVSGTSATKVWVLRTVERLRDVTDDDDDLPVVSVRPVFDLDEGDTEDTARGPAIVAKPRCRGSSQWEITTQIVDMKARKGSVRRKERVIPVSDLVLPGGRKARPT